MPLDPAQFVAGFESSGNPTAQNPNGSASGLYGFVNGTWAAWAPKAGVSLSQYPTAASAPASVQTAVFATDYNAQGFADWTCAGCDARLTSALAAQGGPSAFATPGSLSTSPSSYAALDTGGSVSLADALSPGFNPISSSSGAASALPAGDGATSSGTTSANFAPFSYIFDRYQSAIETPLNTDINLVIDKVAGIEPELAVIAVAVIGIAVALGLRTGFDLKRKAFKIAIVTGAIVSNGLIQVYFVPTINSLPAWLNQNMVAGSASGPVAAFDNLLNSFLALVGAAFNSTPLISVAMVTVVALLLFAAPFIGIALALMFAIFLAANIITRILLVFGGFFFLMLLFEFTEQIFYDYVKHFIGLALLSFGAILISQLAVQLIQDLMAAIPHATSGISIAGNLFGVALAIIAIALTLTVLWRALESITRASGTAQLARSAQVVAQRTAMAAAGGAVGAAGRGVSNVVSFPRRSAPVGRAASRGP